MDDDKNNYNLDADIDLNTNIDENIYKSDENTLKNKKSDIKSQDILSAIDLNKINQNEKKKRGRPKKKELMQMTNKSKISNNDTFNLEEEEIILHLPLSKADLADIDTDNINVNDLVDKNLISSNTSETFGINNIKDNSKSKKTKSTKKSKNTGNELESLEEQNSSEDEDNNLANSLSNMINNNQCVKKLCLAIKKLKDENEELKKYITDITPMYFTEVKVYPLELNLFDNKNNKLIPVKTDLCCWWCTYKFQCLPTFLPEKYSENNFYVFGCFCSFNCAGAYNLSLGDNKVWDRYSLLKLMYYQINKNKINSISEIEINIAGPKELLKKYGGIMDIDEYRKNSKILGREYHKLIPPFVPITFGFEEVTNSKINSSIPCISTILNSKNSDNLIKRNKPLNNSASKQIDFFV